MKRVTIDTMRPLLSSVKRPARYIGGEFGSYAKDELPADGVRICLAFPDVYEVGMSYLGFQILYAMIKTLDCADVERVYCPWIDMETAMRAAGVPLASLESGRPLSEFDAVGFTLQYELSHTNILTMLDLGGIPLEREHRRDCDPIVIAGGCGALNPAPLDMFVDAFAMGDGEEMMADVLKTLSETKGHQRDEKLAALSQIEGIYVPSYPSPVRRRILRDLDTSFRPDTMIVPNMSLIHDRVSVQVFRGCTRGCRFCQAGMIDRPMRERSAASVRGQIERLLRVTGWEEVGLLSLATCDWSGLPELLETVAPLIDERDAKLSLPSLRVDAFSVGLAARLETMRRGGLTFAPEAGSQRLRNVINKGVTEDDIDSALEMAFSHGWDRVKLYFMMGLPTETDDDLRGIVQIAERAVRIAKSHKRKGEVAVSLAGFVPKAHTPFQWEAQATCDELREKGRFTKGLVKRGKITLAYHEPEQTFLEGVYARADSRVAAATLEAWRRGARFDGWTETFDFQRWLDVFRDLEIDTDYLTGPRDHDEALPWDFVDIGTTRNFLARERDRAFREETTADCRLGCHACGWESERICSALLGG